jgi:hypothetical protein
MLYNKRMSFRRLIKRVSRKEIYALSAVIILMSSVGVGLNIRNSSEKHVVVPSRPKQVHVADKPTTVTPTAPVVATAETTPVQPKTAPKQTPAQAPSTAKPSSDPASACFNLLSQYYSQANAAVAAEYTKHQQILSTLKQDYDSGAYNQGSPPDLAQAYNDYQSDIQDESTRWSQATQAIPNDYNNRLHAAGCAYSI